MNSYTDRTFDRTFERLKELSYGGKLTKIKDYLKKERPDVEYNILFGLICEYGFLQYAKDLLSRRSQINVRFNNDYAFQKACERENLEIAQWLYSIIYDPSIVVSAIFSKAIQRNNFDLALWLYKINPNYDISSNDDEAFRIACFVGNNEIINWLLKIKPTINISAMENEAFKEACKRNNLNLAKHLYSLKPDMDLSCCGNEAFLSACYWGNFEMAQWLYSLNPSIDLGFKNDEPFRLVCKRSSVNKKRIDFVKWFLSIRPQVDIFSNDNEIFKSLVLNNYDSEDFELGKFIIIQKYKFNKKKVFLEKSFFVCCETGFLKLAQWIYNSRPDIDICAREDKCFKAACQNNHVEIAKWFKSLNPKYIVNIINDQIESHGIDKLLKSTDDLTSFNAKELDEDNCPICLFKFKIPVQTNCGHSYCLNCIQYVCVGHSDPKCPYCIQQIQFYVCI